MTTLLKEKSDELDTKLLLRVLKCLIDTAASTTDLDNVYDKCDDYTVSWDEIWKVYGQVYGQVKEMEE